MQCKDFTHLYALGTKHWTNDCSHCESLEQGVVCVPCRPTVYLPQHFSYISYDVRPSHQTQARVPDIRQPTYRQTKQTDRQTDTSGHPFIITAVGQKTFCFPIITSLVLHALLFRQPSRQSQDYNKLTTAALHGCI